MVKTIFSSLYHWACGGAPGRAPGTVRSYIQLGLLSLMGVALNTSQAAPVLLPPQLITLPAGASDTLFADTEGHGRCDLFVLDRAAKTLLLYCQQADGFTNAPDQVIPLPPQTAWVAVGEADPHPGLELLASTASGVVYARQDAGHFETTWRTLIPASQVFTNDDRPILISLATNSASTNITIPVISAGQIVNYHRNSAYEWSPGAPITLKTNTTTLLTYAGSSWAMGSSPAHAFGVQQLFRTSPAQKTPTPENDEVQKIMEEMKHHTATWNPNVESTDVDGDGRNDLILWQVSTRLDFKTDIYLFLRGPDGHLPPQPTQALHGSGLPIPSGPIYAATPLHDLKGDGTKELVLLEFNTTILSADGLIKTMLAHGLEWKLTIRTFQQGAFSRSPDGSVPVMMALPAQYLNGWTVFIQGDFNGDGRPDLLVARSDTQWNIFLSTNDGRWFEPQPALTFNVPADGRIETKDLSGDGQSDVIWHAWDNSSLAIFMSPARPVKGKNP